MHAEERVTQRYGISFNVGKLLTKIKDGKAKFVAFGHSSRLIYDVQQDSPHGPPTTIRVVVNAAKSSIVSVLPPEFKSKLAKERATQRKREFYKRFEEDDEEVITPSAAEWSQQ